ncbi:unnamed protein product [Brassica rapa]|uniref:Uncharacterized protein n=1 Tax=Brassica campestris TaxID=3711 RepID=A0A8D9HF10_BRACM|nr:unnamed protein product [Brassica rapa]
MISLVSPTEPFSLYKRNRTGLSVSVSPDSRVVVVVARIGSFVDQKLSHMVPPLRNCNDGSCPTVVILSLSWLNLSTDRISLRSQIIRLTLIIHSDTDFELEEEEMSF